MLVSVKHLPLQNRDHEVSLQNRCINKISIPETGSGASSLVSPFVVLLSVGGF